MSHVSNPKRPSDATALILFADGTLFWGKGFGAETTVTGEFCFNTSMTGYQEILTDPSYAVQIVNFTFPHIGNVGVNNDDMETINPAARGLIVREDVTSPSNWRTTKHFDAWLKNHDLPGISDIDTRALTHHIREKGAPNGVLAVNFSGTFDLEALHKTARECPGLEGMDLAKEVSCTQTYKWTEKTWDLKNGYTEQDAPRLKVVAVDFGAKHNILRCLASAGCEVTVVPAHSTAEDILAHKPDGVFLSNGPGDPGATGKYAVPMIKDLLEKDIPIFGICLGHQLLALALGGQTRKMHLGHRGANQPVKDMVTGKVEITSQNHGFEVIEESLPENVVVSHKSLFDGSNEGLNVTNKRAFSVQYHPEASPGPQDSHYLFNRFVEMIEHSKSA
ncbi:MAG: glutamine-hydrolyzing carbamoyl-phosphate synthase small subunit [Alphaproteobacteria bacterium]|nr:glutamine-hydrolyzing carbamoyl-phosphate synthase small subunit [Alphaproteobacteria bacterium]